MKRIKLGLVIDNFIEDIIFLPERPINEIKKDLIKFIQLNYRRRQHKQKGYSCNTCGKLHKPMQICKKVVK